MNLGEAGSAIAFRDFDGKPIEFCGRYVSANSLFAAHGAGQTKGGGDKRVSNWWDSMTDHRGRSPYLEEMARLEGREWLLELSPEKAAENSAGYFSCQSGPLVIKVRGRGPHKSDYWLSAAPALDAAAYLSVELKAWVYSTMARLIQEGPEQVEHRTYFKRYSLFPKEKLLPKHWCVFLQIPELLEITHERIRLDVAARDLIDGSVGAMWSKYRADKEWAEERHGLWYRFPGEDKDVPIWQYHYRELPYFKEWLDEQYEPEHMYDYMKRKYGEMPAVATAFNYNCSQGRLLEFTQKKRSQKRLDSLMDEMAKFKANNPMAQYQLSFENGNWLSHVY